MAELKIILGYAAGVGKTYRMLLEGQALKAAGEDIVIGYFEPHARQETIALTEGLEFVPRRTVEYRGRQFEEMDTDAVLARHPHICLVDEFAHTNVPGSPRAKRWEDVMVLLNAGIDVITTMNIQHLESLNDRVREVSGVQVRETVPDWVLKQATDIVFVDLTPGALLNRLDRGVVYAPDKARLARENFFREPTLAALRELALRQTAHEVDLRQPDEVSTDRILIHVTESPATIPLIRRGRRVADYLRADCFAVCVLPGDGLRQLSEDDRQAVERHLNFARMLHIDTRILNANDPVEALSAFAHTNSITQIFLTKPSAAGTGFFAAKQLLAMRLIRAARDIQVTLVADRTQRTG